MRDILTLQIKTRIESGFEMEMLKTSKRFIVCLIQAQRRAALSFKRFIMSFILYFRGIKLGQNVNFYGFPQFSRVLHSTLQIQGDCCFRSDRKSNRVGINRACYLSTLKPGAVLKIGHHCGFSGTVIAAAKYIELGSYVRCGANTTIMDSDFHEDDPRSGEPKPVHIEDHVWLGLNVIVLKGVRIGRNSVIAAGSVVTRDIPPNVVAGGVPAKVIKEFSSEVISKTEALLC